MQRNADGKDTDDVGEKVLHSIDKAILHTMVTTENWIHGSKDSVASLNYDFLKVAYMEMSTTDHKKNECSPLYPWYNDFDTCF